MFQLFKGEKRKTYRLKPPPREALELHLILPDGKLLMGNIVNISLGGAQVAFPAKGIPDFAPDEELKLKFIMPKAKKSMVIDAIMKGWSTNKDKKLCRFQFSDLRSFYHELDQSLWDYFNRRERFRVKPDPAVPIEVDVEWDQIRVQGRILDISTNGMALGLEPEIPQILGDPEQLKLTFQLPGSEMPLELVGSVRYHMLEGELVRYGIQFDWRLSGGFYKKEAAIANYMMTRQRQSIQDTSEIEDDEDTPQPS